MVWHEIMEKNANSNENINKYQHEIPKEMLKNRKKHQQ